MMSPLEITACLLGLVNVALIIRRSIWNYPFGFAMVILYAVIFYGAKLYSDALLQIFFFAVQIFGWINWSTHRRDDGRVSVGNLRLGCFAGTCAAAVVGSAALGFAMARWTDAALPYWDAAIAGLSITAQCLLSLRRIENWIFWIVADVIAIGVYFAKDLWLTAGLYGVFLAMAVMGLAAWSRIPISAKAAPT